jgi:cellulose synthase operon protein C
MTAALTLALALAAAAPTPVRPEPFDSGAAMAGASAQDRLRAEGAESKGALQPSPHVRTAWYWEARGRDDRAAEAWQEALREGERPDALAELGSWHARAGRLGEARELLTRLSRRWPGSPQEAQLAQAIAVGARHGALVARARDAARAGRLDDALARYRELFGPAPPPGYLAAEYDDVCAGVARCFDEAVRGLEELSRRVPEHPHYRLSLARALTYRADTREEGVRRLEALAADPAVGREADAALRKALGWLPDSPETRAHVARYLARHPADAELAGVQAQRETSGAAEAGYAALARNDLAAARRHFAEAGPTDARALAGLALVALRERDYGTARALAERARDVSPSDYQTWEGPLRTATFWDLMSRGRAAISAARWDEARAILTDATLVPGADRREAELALADLEEARGARGDAEIRLRALATARPKDAVVLRRLVDVLSREGKDAEALRANEALQRLAPSLAADTRPLRAAEARARAARLRAEGDAAGARQALLAARELDPKDPWPVHDLAQLALERSDVAEARRHAAALAALAPELPQTKAVQARIFAADGDPERALAALDAIPASARDASLEALRRRVDVEATLAKARTLPPPLARERLSSVEGRTGGDPELLVAIGRAWRDAGEPRRAAALFREALKRSATPPAALRLELAAVLADREGADDEVVELAAALRADPALTPSERARARDLAAGIAVRRSDALRGEGNVAGALAALAPALDDDPDDARLLAAKGRALLAKGDLPAARTAYKRALKADPASVDARAGAVEIALALHEPDEARQLATEAAARSPRDARVHLLLARAELGGGDDAAAMRALRAAIANAPERPVPGGEDVPATARAELDRLAARHAFETGGRFELRARDGESGLGALTEIRAPVTASVPVGLAGRVALQVTPVTLDAGAANLGASDLGARLGAGGAAATSLQVRASGVEVRGRWQSRMVSADVGMTPIGFALPNLVGGVKLAVPVGSVDASVEVARREVTESVLSYAGVKDPATGKAWGGVVRDELRLAAGWKSGESSRWASASAGVLSGTGVESNAVLQAGAGADWALGPAMGGTAHAGVSGAALGYRRNLRYFTTGQGGYFSPQALVHGGVPLRVEGGGRVAWELAAEAGVNWFKEDGAAGPDGAAGFPPRSTAGLALDLAARARYAVRSGLDLRVDAEAHHADGYQEIRIAFGLAWQLWAPR